MGVLSRIVKYIKGLCVDLRYFMLPKQCMECGCLLQKEEDYLCFCCLNKISFTNTAFMVDNFVETKFELKVKVEASGVLLHYKKDDICSRLLYQLKYRNGYNIGIWLGKIAAAEMIRSSRFKNVECLIPVPLAPNSYRERGYNQSIAICEGISMVMNIPIYEDVLVRNVEGVKQSSLDYHARVENAIGVYKLKNKTKIENKVVLLVDDIITTGNTAINCIKTIQEAEGVRVYAYFIAGVK